MTLEDHPIAARYPLLEGEEFESLKASIRTHGPRVPIVLYQGKILDGRNRYRACRELGIEPLTYAPDFLKTDADAEALADVLNLERRHLTREQKRAVIALRLKTEPQRSDRSIAAEVKVDHKTVAAVRREMEAGGETPQAADREEAHPQPARRVGRDKKRYTVRAKPAGAPRAAPPTPAPEAGGFREQLLAVVAKLERWGRKGPPSPAALLRLAAGLRQLVGPAAAKGAKKPG